MYQEHYVFEKPDNLDVKVWRFIDFTKYVSMLESKSLYFCRADLFQDIFEGTYPKQTFDVLRQDTRIPEKGKDNIINAFGMFQQYHVKGRYLNCWHINDHESDAMWKLYTNNNLGVAIQTTFKSLTECFNDKRIIYVGKVNYIDYNKDLFPLGNTLFPYVHKRMSYEHEHELRAVTEIYPDKWNENPLTFEKNPNGINIKVDLDKLIGQIYVSPRAPDWFKELVKSISDKYALNKPIESSSLDDRPLFR
ncbi:MAG: hypothetical protein HZC29_02260 [Thaumarchaeota archaeon]|nr:hypothetical protein [Nitrososphaerota archaeon]